MIQENESYFSVYDDTVNEFLTEEFLSLVLKLFFKYKLRKKDNLKNFT